MGSTVSDIRPRGRVRTVTAGDLVQSARILGARYIFENASPDADDALLQGCFETLELRPGLILHAAQVQDLQDLGSVNVLYPGLKIVAVVGGLTEVAYGNHQFVLGPQSPQRDIRCRGILVNLTDTANFARTWMKGRKETKLSLTVSSAWLEQAGVAGPALHHFMQEHLAMRTWQLSARACALVREILQPESFQAGLSRLILESRCVELVAEALGSLTAVATAGRPLSAADRRRLARLEELLDEDEVLDLSCDAIASRIGSNPTSLQQLARRVWGRSVFEQLRWIRMEKAMAAIRGGCPVAQAAEIAGYTSATNFATAFRRCYGLSPREARRG